MEAPLTIYAVFGVVKERLSAMGRGERLATADRLARDNQKWFALSRMDMATGLLVPLGTPGSPLQGPLVLHLRPIGNGVMLTPDALDGYFGFDGEESSWIPLD